MRHAAKTKSRAKSATGSGRVPVLTTALVLVGLAYAVSLFQ
ncbi:MAG: hypothetical protein R3265_12315 [Hyphomonas sp.]|nr:hypothetical protein [Hyphomonas sp.]